MGIFPLGLAVVAGTLESLAEGAERRLSEELRHELVSLELLHHLDLLEGAPALRRSGGTAAEATPRARFPLLLDVMT